MVLKTSVLICGSGSAGLCAATWLSRAGIPFKILEKNKGPMEIGQADGVQCRTVEVFESFGLAEELLREAYHVLEVVFWSQNSEGSEGGEGGKLVRNRRTADTMKELSHMPHVILNQARVNGILLDEMEGKGQVVEYGWEVKSVHVDDEDDDIEKGDEYPVTVIAEKGGVEEVFKAKYVLGCDGAHSSVRKSLGFKMIGDSSDSVWGVMDVYPRTNFPDIRKKAALHSSAGSLIIIPREGGSLVRFYIELPHGTDPKTIQLPDLHKAASKIFHPYTLEIASTFWWSAYPIGQRLADHFTKANRVFLTGDACHTHSPKAGQGMNVSLQDGYNIGWKLAAVLQGRAGPEILETYELERGEVAAELIAFDRNLTKLLAEAKNSGGGADGGSGAQRFSEEFVRTAQFTAGLTAKYGDSIITSSKRSKQHLAKGLAVGMRFPSAQVVRFCDARAMQLVRALPADGRWRLVIFAGNLRNMENAERLRKLGEFLDSSEGPVRRFTKPDVDIDSHIESIVVLHGVRIETEQDEIPPYFCPVTGPWRMRDLHKVFVDDESYNSGHGYAYEKYGVDSTEGAIAVVRPEQYVSLVTAVDDYQNINEFFNGVCSPVV